MLYKNKNLFFVLLLLSIISCANLRNRNDISDERYDISKRAVEQLELKTKWVIENGLSVFFNKGLAQLSYEIENDHYVGIRGKDPLIAEDRFIARFMLESSGIMYDTIVFNRKLLNGLIYEYWVVEIDSADWAYVKRNKYFIITSANSIKSKRTILKAETNYFDTYCENGKEIINFPVDNDFSMYLLSAYLFPNNFTGTDFSEYRYIPNGTISNQTYKRIKLWPWELHKNKRRADVGAFKKKYHLMEFN